jgi:pyruvate/2-oxoglutarate dehydrogenase complex dihydrolipoamide dehydrogenase (E3) component
LLEAADDIVAREDDDVRAALREVLGAEGMAIHTGVRDIRLVPGDGITIEATATGGLRCAGSHLLLAVGRGPNTDGLGLDLARIETNARGFIVTDAALRATADGVWALGYVNGRGALARTSYNDLQIVAPNMLDGADRKAADRIPVYALFTDPPLARIGASER